MLIKLYVETDVYTNPISKNSFVQVLNLDIDPNKATKKENPVLRM